MITALIVPQKTYAYFVVCTEKSRPDSLRYSYFRTEKTFEILLRHELFFCRTTIEYTRFLVD
jgi:hypothetical protein